MFYRIKSENIVYVAFSENFNVHIVAHFFLLPAIGIRNGWKCIWNDSSNTAAPSENQILKRTRKNCDSSLYFDLCVWVFLNGTKAPLQNPPSSLSLWKHTHRKQTHKNRIRSDKIWMRIPNAFYLQPFFSPIAWARIVAIYVDFGKCGLLCINCSVFFINNAAYHYVLEHFEFINILVYIEAGSKQHW